MQCEKYRKAIAAEPSAPGEEVLAHVAGCPDCAAFHDEMLALDASVERALAIDVPELELPALPPAAAPGGGTVVDLRRQARGPAARRRRPMMLVGLAAGIAAVAMVSLLRPSDTPSLAEAVVAHMDHEQASRQVTTVPVAEQALDAVVAPRVSGLPDGIGIVSYASSCVIRGNTVPHLVVQGEAGPITLILLPDEKTERAIELAGEHVHGLILPVGDGSIAIIGGREDQMDEVEATGRRVAETMRWRI
jgi:hypothetical protein